MLPNTPTKIELNIRPIGNVQAAEAAELIISIQRNEFGVEITLDDQPDLQMIDTFYHGPGGTFLGAFQGDELVGTIALIYIGHQSGAIRKMFVKEAYRGKEHGVAQKLLYALLEFCRKKSIGTLYLGTISKFVAAMRFYERNGFAQIEKSTLPEYFPAMRLDHIFYKLTLPVTESD